MRVVRSKKLLAAVAVAVVSASVWVALPKAEAHTNVFWFAGHVVVNTGTGTLDVAATNESNSPKDAVIFVRKFDGTLQTPVANTNVISAIPSSQANSRAFSCSSGPCFFTIEVTTTSTSVVPSVNYVDSSAAPAALNAGDFVEKVVKS